MIRISRLLPALLAAGLAIGSVGTVYADDGMDSLLELQKQNDSVHNKIVDPDWKRNLRKKDWEYKSQAMDFESRKLDLESQKVALDSQKQDLKLRRQEMDNRTRIAKGRQKALESGKANLNEYSFGP